MPVREFPETNPELAKRFPLNIISPKSHAFLNSCYANEPHKIKIQGEQFVMISPGDAAKRNIREGDPVRVQNERGDFEGVARVTDDVTRWRRRRDARLLAVAQPLGRVGQLASRRTPGAASAGRRRSRIIWSRFSALTERLDAPSTTRGLHGQGRVDLLFPR